MAGKKNSIKKAEVKETYIPVFETVTGITETKFDLNWVSVRRKIQKINFKNILENDRFKKPLINPEIKKESYLKNLWIKYEIWFNKVVNKNGR